jgi:hypothetical protein
MATKIASVKKNSPSKANGTPNASPPLTHETRPQQAELEGEHGAGDGADRERHRHVLRPALGQLERLGIVVLDAAVVGHEGHERPRHPERNEDDVEGEGECHLRPGPWHRVDGQDRGAGPSAEHRAHRPTNGLSITPGTSGSEPSGLKQSPR